MNYTETRRLLLKVFIGFLSLTALVAITSVLSREFGETQFKVLVTTFSISAGSICAMSCAGFLERKGAKGVGFAGILAAGVAVLMAIGGVWGEIKETGYWKTTLTSIVVSVAFAHGCLLRLPNLAASYRWTQTVSTILIGLLAVQIILAILGEVKDEGYYRLMAALSVLVVLVTLVIPICSRLGTGAAEPSEGPGQVPQKSDPLAEKLHLRKISAGLFADEAGRRYQVTEITAEPDAPPNGGPATRSGSPEVAEGPPSVS